MQRTGDAELNPENQRWWRQHCGKETSTQKQHPHTLSSCAATLPATHTHTLKNTTDPQAYHTGNMCMFVLVLQAWSLAFSSTHTHTHTHTQQHCSPLNREAHLRSHDWHQKTCDGANWPHISWRVAQSLRHHRSRARVEAVGKRNSSAEESVMMTRSTSS